MSRFIMDLHDVLSSSPEVAQHMRVLDVDADAEFLEQQVSEERIHDIMKASMAKAKGNPKDAETLQSQGLS